jgi:uncharacterized damage-inducible protein DinB
VTAGTIAPFYKGWSLFNDELITAIEDFTPEQLAIPIRKDWPIWASVSHLAGGRVFWLCQILGEAGAETTPFNDPTGFGWEDDLSHPRNATELIGALRSTWRIAQHALDTWTPEMLAEERPRTGPAGTRMHSRQSVIMRIITHDAFHGGEISHTMGEHKIGGDGPNGPIDMWRGLSRPAP